MLSRLAAFTLCVAACSVTPREPDHLATDEATEVALLVRAGTADSLATASLLAHLIPETEGAGSGAFEPMQLIRQAVEMAPQRPDLVWLQLRDCQARRCAEELAIGAHLRQLDPDNGLAWLADFNAALAQSPADLTRVIQQMGNAPRPRVYWNRLTVMMFDALTHRDPAHPATAETVHADDRLMHVTGVLAAVDVPALRPLSFACRVEQFDEPGRREACVQAIARMDASDAVVTQLFRLSMLESWVSPASPAGAALRQERLQRRYSTVASNRLREGHADGDAQMRVSAMRRYEREEEVERAMLMAFHEPLERPDTWRSPTSN